MSRLDQPEVNRRSFLSLSAIGSFLAALAVAAAGALRLPNPTVLPGPARRYKIGPPERYPVGSQTAMGDKNFVILRDAQGIYAISTTCTHLGCTVALTAQGFACPCHGSRFDPNGKVVAGPAPRALPWLELSRAADGQLIVLADNEVPPGTRFEP
jgi:cytochrome b6-f complex iron-sulfur subunit